MGKNTAQFNGKQYNTGKYNSPTSTNTSVNVTFNNSNASFAEDIRFNNFVLHRNDNCSLSYFRHDHMPTRDISTTPTPNSDGETIDGVFYRNKNIDAKGLIKSPTAEGLETLIDELKKNLDDYNGNLDIKVNGVIRRYKAMLTNTDSIFEREHYHITFLPISLKFRTLSPFAQDLNYTSLSLIAQTALSFNQSILNEGTITSKPVILLVFSAASGVSKINIQNLTTSQEIELTATINAGDIIIFDTEDESVKINGVTQDFTGKFLKLKAGANILQFTITGTSATFDFTIKYKKNFL